MTLLGSVQTTTLVVVMILRERKIRQGVPLLKGYTLSRMRPSVEMVTTFHAMNLPQAYSALFTAFSMPPQQGTSIRTTVMLRMLLLLRISVSFPA